MKASEPDRTVVTCNGCFDNLHPGHLFFLGYCAAQGDELVVGINSDRYIRARKHREPMRSVPERASGLLALGFIHDVRVFDEDDASAFIRRVLPDVQCIGREYRGVAPEENVCRDLGIRIVYVPRVGEWSSTALRAPTRTKAI